MHVLVVEDDDSVGAPLCGLLRHHGFEVTRARTARSALDAAVTAGGVDVVLLDLGLPDRDGTAVLGDLRRISQVPVIVVTARGDVAARLHGLNLGADDYVVKPYDVRELVARIHAVSRRLRREELTPAVGTRAVEVAGLRIDEDARTVTQGDGAVVALTRKEFDVLVMLARQPGVVFRREQIASEVWRSSWESSRRTLEVHVASLRAKLSRPEVVETVRGVGYRLQG